MTKGANKMKAVIHDHYGPTSELRVGEVDRPHVQAGQVLVRVLATSVHADIWHVVTGRPYAMRLFGSGLFRPKTPVPGTDLAGVVEEVGEGVTRFEAGEAVFGEVAMGMQWKNGGSFAEYIVVPERAITRMPKNLSFQEAAALCTSGLIAMLNLQDSERLSAKNHLLINGAGGAVGLLALQIAKAEGLTVTAVDKKEKLATLASLGADQVVDYEVTSVESLKGPFDVIMDVASTLDYGVCKRLLANDGKYVLIGHDHYGKVGGRWLGSLPHFFGLMVRAPFEKNLPKLKFQINHEANLEALRQLSEKGLLKPVLDRSFSLDEVTDALKYVEEGRARGHVVLTPNVL
jgi:NADPH:quinone reductase-like Zn-dependent oxidoreductase